MDTTILYFTILLFTMIKANQSITYKICKKGGKWGRPSCENIYVWNNDLVEFISLFNVPFSNDQAYNSSLLRNTTVRVIADNMLPYITSSNYSQPLGGFLGDIWQLVEDGLGFKTNVSSVNYDTGLEIITAGGADVMLGAVVERAGLLNIKYSQPYFYNWYHLFIRKPEPKASSSSYIKIFENDLWLVVIITFLVLTVFVWASTKCLNHTNKIEPSLSLPSCFIGMMSGFINQGFNLQLSSYSGRMQVMFALWLGIILYNAMNAVLVAQLAVFDIPFPFTSVGDIANKRTHSLCLRSNSFVYNNFTNENREIQPNWKGILNGPRCLDINNQTNLALILCKARLVILENRVVMDTVLKNYFIPCSIVNRKEKLFTKANTFLLWKGFKYKKIINGLVKKMKSAGILQRIEYKWVRKEKLVDLQDQQTIEVTIDHISGILVLYSIMIIISICLLSLEIVYDRYTKRRLHKKLLFTR